MATCDNLMVLSEVDGPLITVVVSGEVDLDTASQLRDELLRQLRPACRVRLDLTGVTFMDSSGLHVLISSKRRADLIGADFGVGEVSHQVQRLLEISGTAKLLRAPVGAVSPEAAVAPPRRAAGRILAPMAALSSLLPRRTRQT